jgi:hypothetical protein
MLGETKIIKTVSKEDHEKAAKAALNFLGPRAVLELLNKEIADRHRGALNVNSRNRYERVLRFLAKARNVMDETK